MEAGMLNTALRVGVEDWALRSGPAQGPSLGETVTGVLRMAAHVIEREPPTPAGTGHRAEH
jgi:hypothetical protein